MLMVTAAGGGRRYKVHESIYFLFPTNDPNSRLTGVNANESHSN